MTEEIKEPKETKKPEEPKVAKVEQKPEVKRTICYLVSKADYIVPVVHNNQNLFIQPFGKIKVTKELTKINPRDARYLTFVKI